MTKIPELVIEIETELKNIQNESAQAQTILDERIEKATHINNLVTKAREDFIVLETELNTKLEKLTTTNKELEKEKDKLSGEVSGLVEKKSNLTIDLARGQKKLDQFQKYEETAWKKLEAQDSALQIRENAVAEKEQLSPRNQSFLPSVEG